jgi:hypothetical protein
MARQSFGVEYDKAVRRGRREASSEPRAKRAYYDCSSRQIVVELTNKTKFVFPCDVAQGLVRATDEDLEIIEISPSGAGLHWPALDVDLSLSALMRGVFGTDSWMRRLRVRARKKKSITTKGSSQTARRRGDSA